MQKLLTSRSEKTTEQSKQTTNSDTKLPTDEHVLYSSVMLKEGQTLKDVELRYKPYQWMNDF